MEIKTWRRNK